MYKYHTTAEGKTMLICQMSDPHLLNTIKLIMRNTLALHAAAENSNNQTAYERRLYDQPTLSPEMLADKIKGVADLIAPYVLEASLRGLEVSDLLQAMFKREEQVPFVERTSWTTIGSGQADDEFFEDDFLDF